MIAGYGAHAGGAARRAQGADLRPEELAVDRQERPQRRRQAAILVNGLGRTGRLADPTYGWRWAPTAKHLTGIPWEVTSMIDGLDDTWPTSLRPDAATATPSMFGPPGWIVRFTPSCS